MKDVNERFLDVYNYLLNEKLINNASDIANKIGISTSMITEILKKRSNAGLKVIQGTVKEFSFIDTEWLLTGVGEMLKSKENIPIKVKKTSIEDAESEQVQKLEEQIKELRQDKEELRRDKERLIKEKDNLEKRYNLAQKEIDYLKNLQDMEDSQTQVG